MKVVPIISVEEAKNETENTSRGRSLKNRHFSLSETVSLADLKKAQKFRNDSSLRICRSDQTYTKYPICSTELKTLGKYGVGLELYFLLIKQLCILFLVISAISCWPMYENYKGGGLGSLFQGQLYSYFSVANEQSLLYETNVSNANDTISNLKKSALNLSIADGIYTLMFLAFILQYSYVSQRVTKANLVDNVTVGDYAIEIKGLPRKNIKIDKVKQHFRRFGDIAEVYLSRIYNGRLSEYKKRAEISYKLGLRKLMGPRKGKRRRGTINILEKAQLDFDEALNVEDMLSDKTHDELPVGRGYIVFERLEDKTRCLNEYKGTKKCCWKYRKQDKKLMFKGKYPLIVKPATEPSDIIWENLEISHCRRINRRILGFFITLTIMIASISIVYILKSYSNSVPSADNCREYNINGGLSVDDAELKYTDQKHIDCYCKQQNLLSLFNKDNVHKFCKNYLYRESVLALYRFLGSSGVIFINLLLKVILAKLSSFERTSTETKQKLQTMTRVFIALFINTSILTLLANANLQDNDFLKLIPWSKNFLNGNYSDFQRNWYTEVGSVITATLIVNAISPHYLILMFWYPIGCLKRTLCWKCYKSQAGLNEMFAGPEFNIATRTSQVLTTIFSCFLYSGGMPILNIICFLTLFSIFWIDKTLILRHYRKPPFYSAAINERLVQFLPLAVILHCSFSLYIYGASDIFPSSVEKPAGNKYVQVVAVGLGERMYRYTGIINLILIMMGLGFVLLKLVFIPLCGREKNLVTDVAGIHQGSYTVELAKIKEQGLHSYNIMENSTYRPLIISLNSAATRVARLRSRSKRPPPSPVSDLAEEELETKHFKNEDNNVLVP